jgi:hypothetical protein
LNKFAFVGDTVIAAVAEVVINKKRRFVHAAMPSVSLTVGIASHFRLKVILSSLYRLQTLETLRRKPIVF